MLKSYFESNKDRLRICVSCRLRAPRAGMIRITGDYLSGKVVLNLDKDRFYHGRSAYLCKKQACLDQALKGNRLKIALSGQAKKGKGSKRTIQWPLEAQLIKDIEQICADTAKRCENTVSKEGSE